MEDTLAIALAIKENTDLRFKLLSPGRRWIIKNEHDHKIKMNRKVQVYKAYEDFFNLPDLKNNVA
jgi:hypothetical protein